MIHPHLGHYPEIHRDALVWPSSTITGKVKIGKRSSIWPGVVMRGDVNEIIVGEDTNIQDLTLCHVTATSSPLIIGNRVTVGHSVVLHSCIIEDDCLIGISATILDNAKIGKGSLVAAGALVLGNQEFPENSFIVGSPAKLKGPLTPEQKKMLTTFNGNYLRVSEEYRKG